jgi:heme/copper-type cytochrome/quinol oxidase subunit 3
MIAASVLADSAMEHYRGEFHNRAMWTPILTAALSVAASVHGHTDRRTGAHNARDLVYAAAGLTGLIGTGFHLYNMTKKPGGLCWQNLFYAAPIGAPAALSLSGLMGFLSERVRANQPGTSPTVAGFSAGRAVAALTGASLLGTVGEAGVLHFRGAYHNTFMLLSVSFPPVAAVLLGNAAVGRSRVRRHFTRWWLPATTLMGIAGVAFHTYGVSRSLGGWRNWRQNAFMVGRIETSPAGRATGVHYHRESAWQSLRGGDVDARIELDTAMRRSAEGELVINAGGACLGMAVYGPRRRVLVIPAATIARVADLLVRHGRIARGYLGLALQPVETEAHQAGAMVMGVDAGGPGAAAGVRRAGQAIELRLTVGERPAG